MKFLSALALIFVSFALHAAPPAVVHECGELNRTENILVGPRSFSNGTVRAAYVSTEEPAAAHAHILVIVYGSAMETTCYAISQNADGFGYSAVDFKKLKSSRNDKGLLLSIPVYVSDGEKSNNAGNVNIRIDQSKEPGQQVTLE